MLTSLPPSSRLLGHLLCLAPARNEDRFGVLWDQSLLLTGTLTVRYCSGPMSVPREHPSGARQYFMAAMEEGTSDHCTARATARSHTIPIDHSLGCLDKARRCDNDCCMLAGKRDFQASGLIWVDVAHIIPEASNDNIGKACDVFLLLSQEIYIASPFCGSRTSYRWI
ncbi:hypothetical protein EDC04DRAFT_853575 [Pisolithus marmoratus]|nr:hypothetical protein EDC04DRAFT_853575 [Pisolithus marmoratus]